MKTDNIAYIAKKISTKKCPPQLYTYRPIDVYHPKFFSTSYLLTTLRLVQFGDVELYQTI